MGPVFTLRPRPRQLALRFEDAPLWAPLTLEATLAREARRPLHLTLTENRSVLLSFRRHGSSIELRLHRMFLHASLFVVKALAKGLRRRSRQADGEVRRFMNDNLFRVKKAERKLPPLATRGRVHDLGEIFARLNQKLFRGRLAVPITWGKGSGRARRGGLTFGSYDPVLGLIRIHPVLDRCFVPLYFLESVVYHEMLHHHLGGVADRAGRTVYHSRTFRQAEAQYPWHREALVWEKENLPHLLRASQSIGRERRAAKAVARKARTGARRRSG